MPVAVSFHPTFNMIGDAHFLCYDVGGLFCFGDGLQLDDLGWILEWAIWPNSFSLGQSF